MKGFQRDDLEFSLCGLNYALCPMKLGSHCPGCGGGAGNQSCAIARCSLDHGRVQYCHQCPEYPCGAYWADEPYDSFITHCRRREDMERLRQIGPSAYHQELAERQAVLAALLDQYNDGRRKGFYCVAANMLPLDGLRAVMGALNGLPSDLSPKERAAQAVGLLQELARRSGVELKLRRKPRKTN